MADRRKRGEDKNTKTWISRERKEPFRWNKKHFSYFLRGYHEKLKFDKKIADTSFKNIISIDDLAVLLK